MKFGKISDEEMSMKNCPLDPGAGAVVLFDKMEISHPYDQSHGIDQNIERHVRIKIFKKEGYDMADWRLPFINLQKFASFKASTYNLEGGKTVETELEKEQVFDEKLAGRYSVRKFAMPAVREGSVIEVKYTLHSDHVFLIPDMRFQHARYPTLWSEFYMEVPSFIEFKKVSLGWEPFAVAKEDKKENLLNLRFTEHDGPGSLAGLSTTENYRVRYDATTMHYAAEKVPALKMEPFVASPSDYLTQFRFDIAAIYNTQIVAGAGDEYRMVNGMREERNDSWAGLAKDLLDDWLDDHLDSDRFTADEAQKAAAGRSTNADKVAAVYALIGKNFQSNGLDWPTKSQSLKSLMDSHKGTPTDLNLLCINLLRRAKLNAWPVLASTREHGRVLPWNVSLWSFDRILTAFETDDKQVVLLDASAWPNPIGVLPLDDLNGQGFLIRKKDDTEWVPLAGKVANRDAVAADLALTADGQLKGVVSFSASGFDAVGFREKTRSSSEQAAVAAKFKPLLADGSMADLKLENADKPEETSLKGSFSIETKAGATASAGKIYLQPTLGLADGEQPFKAKERKFDIDFGAPSEVSYSLTFAIPAGWKVEEMPKSARMAFGDKALTFDFMAEQAGDKIKFNIKRKIRSTYVEAAQYDDLKQFYTAMLAKLGEQVVLSKA